MEMGLDPSFDPYRPLTPADLKLLSFLTTVGEIRQINDLSIHLDLHRNTIVRLLKDYQKNKLLYRVVHFFNLGLDLSIHVYLQLPHCERNVPFLTQAQSLPWIDIFKTETKDTTIYFGKMRIPQMWTAAFISRMHVLRTTFPDLRLQYSFDPPQHAKWNLSLLETYDME